MVTRSRARLTETQQSMENATENGPPEMQVNKVKEKKKRKKVKTETWTRAQLRNYYLTGDIYKGLPEPNTVTCETYLTPAAPVVVPAVVPAAVLPAPVIPDPIIPDPIISTSESEDSSEEEEEEEEEVTFAVQPEPMSYKLYPELDSDIEEDIDYSTPKKTGYETSDTEGDFATPTQTEHSSPEEEVRGAAGPYPHEPTRPDSNRGKQTTRHLPPSAPQKTGFKSLLKDFGDFVLGTEPTTDTGPSPSRQGVSPEVRRGTRSAGPAPDIPLPRIPLERKPTSRGATGAVPKDTTANRGTRGTRATTTTRGSRIDRPHSRGSSRGSSESRK
jgi:hypothetical protein